MIAPDAEPIDHRTPYKPIDISGRKPARPVADDASVDPTPYAWLPIEDLYKAP